MNTVYRKEKRTTGHGDRNPKDKKRIPFSFTALLSSSGYKQITAPGTAETNPLKQPHRGPYRINLGIWAADEVQLCEMGSKDADGVYKSVGSISLR